jgi:hypothetical protein
VVPAAGEQGTPEAKQAQTSLTEQVKQEAGAAEGVAASPTLTEQVDQMLSPTAAPIPATFTEPFKPKVPKPPKEPTGAEYAVGAVILNIVGALFVLTAFITFGITYLEGFIQGAFLYAVPAALIALSELYVKRHLPKFSHALTGLGVAALYAATVINYMNLHIISSIVSIVMTILIAAFAFFISRKRDSAAIRIISFLGCYISFLMLASEQGPIEFIISLGILFVVNVSGVYYPAEKRAETINNVHMGLNTLFIIIYSSRANAAGVSAMYIILGYALSLAFLNIAYLKQSKSRVGQVLFGVYACLMGAFMIGFSSDLITPLMAYTAKVYNSLIVILLVAAISIFFYIVHTGRADEAFQYYYGMIFTLFMLVGHNIEHLYIWGLIALFVIAKCWRRAEGEPMNALMTAVLFLAALNSDFEWIYLGVVALAILSILQIRRWRLYYQYAITFFLVMFTYNNAPTGESILPIVAAVLFALVPAFHFFALRWGETLRGDRRDILFSQIYNLTNLGAFALTSLLCLNIKKDLWYASIVALFGAAWLVLYLSPRFYLEFSKKYLVLVGYLTVMTLVLIPFPDPILVSITMMVIAIVSVAIGIRIEDRAQRQCGLALAIFVCAKIWLFDFRESEPLQRMIVFAAVGALAMLISFIYIRVEKGLKAAVSPPSDEADGENTVFSEIGVEKNGEEVYNVTKEEEQG